MNSPAMWVISYGKWDMQDPLCSCLCCSLELNLLQFNGVTPGPIRMSYKGYMWATSH